MPSLVVTGQVEVDWNVLRTGPKPLQAVDAGGVNVGFGDDKDGKVQIDFTPKSSP
jgi:hypothetical protein